LTFFGSLWGEIDTISSLGYIDNEMVAGDMYTFPKKKTTRTYYL